MAKKRTGSKNSNDEVLESLANLQMNYLSKKDDDTLKRIDEVVKDVKKENTELVKKEKQKKEKSKKLNEEVLKNITLKSEDLTDEDLQFLLKSAALTGVDLAKAFKIIRDQKNRTFVKQGKLERDFKAIGALATKLNPTIKIPEVSIPEPKIVEAKKLVPAKEKKQKQTKSKKSKKNKNDFEQQSFSMSKDRLLQELNTEKKNQSLLVLQELSVSEITSKIKSINNVKELYKFTSKQITIIRNNLFLKMNGQDLSKNTSFVNDTLTKMLTTAKNATSMSDKRMILTRIVEFSKNVESKILKNKLNPIESEFLSKVAALVFNTVQQDIKIGSSFRSKLSRLNFGTPLDKITEAIETINPFAGVLVQVGLEAIKKTGKLAGKIFENKTKDLIDSDLDDIFNFQEDTRKEDISESQKKESVVKERLAEIDKKEEEDRLAQQAQEKTETVSEEVVKQNLDSNKNLTDLKEDQKEQTDVLKGILDAVTTDTNISRDLLLQNKEWKREEGIQLSKQRISEENSGYKNPFEGVIPKSDKKPGSDMTSKVVDGLFGSLGMEDVFKGNVLSKIFIGALTLLTKGVRKYIGIAFKFLVQKLLRGAMAGIGKFLFGTAARALFVGALGPIAITAGIGLIAYQFKDEIWGMIKGLFNVLQEPVKKAIEYVAEKLLEVKDLIVGKGKQIYTNVKEFFKSTFDVFGNDKSNDSVNKLQSLESELLNERKGIRSNVNYLTKNKLPLNTKVGGSTLTEKYNKVSKLESKIAETKKQIQSNASSASNPKMDGQIGMMTAMSESGNNAGLISSGKGDAGGKSYGIYQLATNTGTLKEFVDASPYKNILGKYPIGSKEFDATWESLAKTDPNFAKSQHDFIEKTHSGKMNENLKEIGLDVSKRGDALKETIFSTANHYGPDTSVIKNALKGMDTNNMSDDEIISTISDYKVNSVGKYFKKSIAKGTRPEALTNRFVREKNEMLAKSRNDKLIQGGKDKETQMASNNIVNNNVSNGSSGTSGGSIVAGTSSTRNNESTFNMLQMHSMRGTPMG